MWTRRTIARGQRACRKKSGKGRQSTGFPDFRRSASGAVLGCWRGLRGADAAGGPSEMQESEHKYKWYYSPKCTFKNEKKAGREKTMVSVLTRAKKCAKISFVFEKDAGVAQSVEQLIRNQQVRCSSHPTSSRHRTLFECGAFLYSNRITLKGRSVTGCSGFSHFCRRISK